MQTAPTDDQQIDSGAPIPIRTAGIALLAASLLTAFAMAHHPVANASDIAGIASDIARKAGIDRLVHGSLIVLIAVILLAYIELACHLSLRRPIVRCAIVAFAIGTCAMFAAALIDGFVLSWMGERYAQASAADLAVFQQLLALCAVSIRTLADFGMIGMSIGYACFGVALLQQRAARALGIAGLLLAGAPVAALLIGALRLDMRGMLGVVLAQTLWNIALATQMIRGRI